MREHWIEKELGEIVFTTSGGTPSRNNPEYYRGDIPWVKSGELDKGVIRDTEEKISEEAVRNSSAKKFPVGTLLFALYGATIGKMAFLGVEAATNQAICGIFKNEKITLNFLYYFLQFKKTELISQGTGGAQPNISQTILKKLSVPVAPLPIQRAIVSKIETLFSDLDKGIEDLNKAKNQLVIYRQAVLKKAFEGGLTQMWRQSNRNDLSELLKELKATKESATKNKLIAKGEYFPDYKGEDLTFKTPNNWLNLPWKTICSNNKYAMKRGPFGSALKKQYFVEQGIPVYEQGHAINDDPYRHRYFITTQKFEELKAFETNPGDMIISCSGVTLGRICLLPEDADKGVINQALLKVDMDENIMLKEYFIHLFRSGTFQKLIFEKSLGTAMPNMVGMTELKEIPIPVPPIEEQKQILKEIESRLSVCDKVEQNIEESLEKAKALRQSILKKAFEGKLLTKEEIEKCKAEADYEPASVLLERIEGSRNEKMKKAKTK